MNESGTRQIPWIDWSIKAALGAIILALVFLAYTMITTTARDRQSTPAARAVANLLEVVEENRDDPIARLRLADALAAAGRLREAGEQYQTVLELRPDDPQALAGLALLAMDQNEWRTAEGYWRTLVTQLQTSEFAALDQRLEKAYYYLGSTLMEVNEYEEAAVYLREALRIRRDASDTYFLLAIAHRELGSDLKYRENIEFALTFDPLLPEGNFELGKIKLADGDEAGAAEAFRISAENAPPDRTEPLDELAKFGTAEEHLATAAELEASDPAGALVEARIAAAVEPRNLDAARAVARLYERQEQKEAALAAWERVLTLSPKDTEAETALGRLRDAS
ncbi:MAG: tetratricopeptide repeat protein [Coriobacteriia bacterium]|nr:tetratricopeptide repeat protein [Coriobacteriia bacterium]